MSVEADGEEQVGYQEATSFRAPAAEARVALALVGGSGWVSPSHQPPPLPLCEAPAPAAPCSAPNSPIPPSTPIPCSCTQKPCVPCGGHAESLCRGSVQIRILKPWVTCWRCPVRVRTPGRWNIPKMCVPTTSPAYRMPSPVPPLRLWVQGAAQGRAARATFWSLHWGSDSLDLGAPRAVGSTTSRGSLFLYLIALVFQTHILFLSQICLLPAPGGWFLGCFSSLD